MTEYRIERYTGEKTFCDDCEEYPKNFALWLVIGAGPTGYLYLCNMHKDEFENDAEQDY
jgi:hypothetical protein